jgi:hypothetical protein
MIGRRSDWAGCQCDACSTPWQEYRRRQLARMRPEWSDLVQPLRPMGTDVTGLLCGTPMAKPDSSLDDW